ncbi:MAG: CPBP family intramembrane metalloprotease [Rhodobacteraceae bacterium]|nr:CPBP family intramembrane metalloprotease [Paracoccaceae bacterium]
MALLVCLGVMLASLGAMIFSADLIQVPSLIWSREFEAQWLLLTLAAIGFEAVLLLGAVALLHRRSPWSVIGPANSAARMGRHALAGAGLVAALFLVALGYDLLFGDLSGVKPQLYTAEMPGYVAAAVALIIVQAASEEIMFRGYLLQQIAAWRRSPWLWAVAPALMFGLLHFDPGQAPERAWGHVAAASLFGLLASYTTWRTGGLGFVIGVHIANNWIALLILGEAGDQYSILAAYVAPPATGMEMALWSLAFCVATIAAMELPGSPLKRMLGTPPLFTRSIRLKSIEQVAQ